MSQICPTFAELHLEMQLDYLRTAHALTLGFNTPHALWHWVAGVFSPSLAKVGVSLLGTATFSSARD